MRPYQYIQAIKKSGLSIYDVIDKSNPTLWIHSPVLEEILNAALVGMGVDYPNRTRSKVVKTTICEALGYPTPKGFKKSQPRFPGQDFDVYVQKSNNLQIWNEEVLPSRRYVLIDVNEDKKISSVRVVTGEIIAQLDRTGTLTTKYQASLQVGTTQQELVSQQDTERVLPLLSPDDYSPSETVSPIDLPSAGNLIAIQGVFAKLSTLVGQSFPDPGADQERNRGAALHTLICTTLGFSQYQDNGSFPDILQQLLEVKLQTSPTVDLGLVLPTSDELLAIPAMKGQSIRHQDVRYALFYAETNGQLVTLTHLVITTGNDFFNRMPQFGGKVQNSKIQIPLPKDFFNTN